MPLVFLDWLNQTSSKVDLWYKNWRHQKYEHNEIRDNFHKIDKNNIKSEESFKNVRLPALRENLLTSYWNQDDPRLIFGT